MNGLRLATTGYQKILLTPDEIRKPEKVLALEKVIGMAVESLSDQAHNMESLLLSSIVFQNSGSPGPFEKNIPSGSKLISVKKSTEAGRIVTSQP